MIKQNIDDIFCLTRPKHWIKNFFVFAVLVFSGQFFNAVLFLKSFWVFIGFCLLASGVYIINDFCDRNEDRHHPEKKKNRFCLNYGGEHFFLIGGLFLIGFFILSQINIFVVGWGFFYIFINLLYSIFFKKVPFLEILFVASGFLIRIWAGGAGINIHPSFFMQMCVLFLALFLTLAKRRYELLMLKDKAFLYRSVLKYYNKYRLDQLMILTAVFTIMAYISYMLYMILINSIPLTFIYSIIFVIYGIFRYIYLSYVQHKGGNPCDLILSDRVLMMTIIFWAAWSMWVVYARHF